MTKSLGLIETEGLAAGIEAADAAVKSANVELIGYELTKGGGWTTVKIQGNVGAVKAAVDAARIAAAKVNRVVSTRVIPRPSAGLDVLVHNPDTVGDAQPPEEPNMPKPPTPPKGPGTDVDTIDTVAAISAIDTVDTVATIDTKSTIKTNDSEETNNSDKKADTDANAAGQSGADRNVAEQPDAAGADTDAAGQPDAAGVDRNAAGQPDAVGADRNTDGQTQAQRKEEPQAGLDSQEEPQAEILQEVRNSQEMQQPDTLQAGPGGHHTLEEAGRQKGLVPEAAKENAGPAELGSIRPDPSQTPTEETQTTEHPQTEEPAEETQSTEHPQTEEGGAAPDKKAQAAAVPKPLRRPAATKGRRGGKRGSKQETTE